MTAALAFVVAHWRLTLALALAAIALVQSERLERVGNDFDRYRVAQQEAALRQQALAANSSVEAMTIYVDRISSIDVPVAAVRSGLAGLCQPAAAPGMLGAAGGTSPGRADAADRPVDPVDQLDQLASELQASERNKARLMALRAGFEAFHAGARQ